jgi:hypothetical protein
MRYPPVLVPPIKVLDEVVIPPLHGADEGARFRFVCPSEDEKDFHLPLLIIARVRDFGPYDDLSLLDAYADRAGPAR